ncbi:Kinesin [Chondrus crispus]|uniref:Kinesin n=1 Tax=Chondrus crispus TaxID=2769 RepID=R7Q5Y9_CHOCR|nr:Kinesin [Chondrus crispus]CDF32880.1 Kinesin [Chondrus crispus]|eukprot:XP_005712681.1 Kinesin [Chondrus crispus]
MRLSSSKSMHNLGKMDQIRKPLSEVSNKQVDIRSSQTQKQILSAKPTIKKPSEAPSKRSERPSRLPLVPRRHTQTGVPPKKPTPPVPSRSRAKPKRIVAGAPHNRREIGSQPEHQSGAMTRRATTSMNFTRGRIATVPVRKPSSEEVMRQAANTQCLRDISLKTDKLLAGLSSISSDQEATQIPKSICDELGGTIEMLQKQIQSLQSDRDAKVMELMEGKFETKSELLEVNSKLKQSEFFVDQQKNKVAALEKELEELRAKYQTLERGKAESEDGVQVAKGTLEALERHLEEANGLKSTLEEDKRKLQMAIKEQKNAQESMQDESNRLIAKLKELQRRLEVAESEISSQEANIRRIRREKESAESERDDFERELGKKANSLQEQIVKYEELAREAESLKSGHAADRQVAEGKFAELQREAASRVESLERDLQEKQSSTIEILETQAREDAAMRRKLHNAIQELKGNIRVFCRVRPLLPKELECPTASKALQMFEYKDRGHGLVARPPSDESKGSLSEYPFKFDRVFGPQSDQASVFEEISQLVQSALDGYRVCIFAYGQTGSGKTHTMLGERGAGDAQLGMVPRSVRQVFQSAKEMEKDQWSFKLKASFLEIYNESIRDLLVDNSGSNKSKSKDEQFKVIFNPETKLSSVGGLTIIDVENELQVQRLVEKSMKNRATAATHANERSSRSHSVFRLYIEGRNGCTGQKLNGLLNLVDLAGSERLKQNCKTLMFVNVSHASESFNESLCSLRFASKVNSCHVGTARRSAKIEL